MAGGDAALPAEANRGFGDRFQAVRVGIVGFVGVKIEIKNCDPAPK